MANYNTAELFEELEKAAHATPIILNALYHGTRPPTNAAEVLIYPYPERMRLLKLCGSKITLSSSDYETFASACKLMQYLSGTSAYAEMQREVNLMLNADISLNEENCDLVWKMIAKVLMEDSAELLSRLNVKKLVANPNFALPYNCTEAFRVPDLSGLTAASARELKKSLTDLENSTDMIVTSLATLETALEHMISSAHTCGVNTVSVEIKINDFTAPNPYSAEQALKTVLFGKEGTVGEDELLILRLQILRTVCKILCANDMKLALRVVSDKGTTGCASLVKVLDYLVSSKLLPRTNLIISPEMMICLAGTDAILAPTLLTADISVSSGRGQTVEKLKALSAVVPLSRISAPMLSSIAQIAILKEALCRVLADAVTQGSAPNDISTLADLIKAFCYRNCSDFYFS